MQLVSIFALMKMENRFLFTIQGSGNSFLETQGVFYREQKSSFGSWIIATPLLVCDVSRIFLKSLSNYLFLADCK